MTNLQKSVSGNSAIEKVYLNENGDWLFYEHPDFPIVKTREEVLGNTPLETESTEVLTPATK